MNIYFEENKIPWLLVVMLGLAAVVLVGGFCPFVPDYDGLAYFGQAKDLREYFFYFGERGIGGNSLGGLYSNGVWRWPITNGPGVYAATFLSGLLGANYVPVFVNFLGAAVFTRILISKRGAGYTSIVLILLCSNILMFRLFTTLTSEFLVGLWLFLFLLFAVEADEQNVSYAWMLVLFGVALRTINIVFIFAVSGVLVLIWVARGGSWRRILKYFLCMAPPLILVAILQWAHVEAVIDYMFAVSYGTSAASWRSLAGVEGRLDVFLRYIEYLLLYNSVIVFLFCVAIVLWLWLGDADRPKLAKCFLVAIAAVTPLFLAQSLNVQVVFWVYAALVFFIAEVGLIFWRRFSPSRRRGGLAAIGCLALVAMGASLGIASWKWETRYLGQLAKLTEIRNAIAKEFADAFDVHYFASNYRGVGPLDLNGITFDQRRFFQNGSVVDIYSKGKSAESYLDVNEKVNIFVAARQNYFFPPHFGVNDVIPETYRLFQTEGPERGFMRIAEVEEQGRGFDVWYRPGMNVFLQFLEQGDRWIASTVPVGIGTSRLCRSHVVSGSLEFDLSFPRVERAPEFTPPFVVLLKNVGGEIVGTSVVDKFGESRVIIEVHDVPCGNYSLSIDKSFSSPQDPRPLSAMLVKFSSALRFDRNGAVAKAP